jgi:3-hydroxyisobutyrate dehydrogenase-like beta-hydroxyacid dehydrogenase
MAKTSLENARMANVALLGTGLLGTGLAEGLLARGGTQLMVWNRSPGKAAPLGAGGATVAPTPAAAVAGAERVHLILRDDDSVEEVIGALRPGLAPGAVIVDHTTTLPARTAERRARLAGEGVAYLHAPVFMSPAAARSAQGMMMVAGDPALFARVRDALASMTGELWYVGARPDLAAAYKLFGNAMLLVIAGGLSDVFHMADAAGVPRRDAFALFGRFKVEGGMQVRGTRIVEEQFEASFTLEMARKDARLMLETAGTEPVPLLDALAARMDAVIARGFGAYDMAVLAKAGI